MLAPGMDFITWAQPTRWAKTVATIVTILPILGGVEPHFHAWLRSGRIFTMVTRPFTDRTTAHRWAAKQRPGKEDRLVLACTEYPPTRPSKRRPPRWATRGAPSRRGPAAPSRQPSARYGPCDRAGAELGGVWFRGWKSSGALM